MMLDSPTLAFFGEGPFMPCGADLTAQAFRLVEDAMVEMTNESYPGWEGTTAEHARQRHRRLTASIGEEGSCVADLAVQLVDLEEESRITLSAKTVAGVGP
ncbi:hypothetical protein I6B53_10440 [Schaalia sp. 19OD2882]|uniref:hypothetical protein n=1 Tax=Schaalia sp. 19OD2882 TaxID=2794089 RepID=UPI001C1EE397|nr:hypothetical protein [Schaalia sp. 19OD2882]QWW19481.1 hypothetical protein I6B53_10440 [Schaalia sp. 19OD2882]